MTSIGPGRALAGCSGSLSIGGIVQRNPKDGRQGKSAASGRAHMVGWLEFYGLFNNRAGWRSSSKPKRFQCPARRRHQPEPPSTP